MKRLIIIQYNDGEVKAYWSNEDPDLIKSRLDDRLISNVAGGRGLMTKPVFGIIALTREEFYNLLANEDSLGAITGEINKKLDQKWRKGEQ